MAIGYDSLLKGCRKGRESCSARALPHPTELFERVRMIDEKDRDDQFIIYGIGLYRRFLGGDFDVIYTIRFFHLLVHISPKLFINEYVINLMVNPFYFQQRVS